MTAHAHTPERGRSQWTARTRRALASTRGELVNEYVVVLGVIALGIAAMVVLLHGATGAPHAGAGAP